LLRATLIAFVYLVAMAAALAVVAVWALLF
jgi:hypothetical protein